MSEENTSRSQPAPEVEEGFRRDEWLKACHFHEISEGEVLKKVAEKVQLTREAHTPLILLDLDSTLYEVAPRTLAIIEEWLTTNPALPSFIREALKKLELQHIGYSLLDTFTKLGLPLTHPEVQDTSEKLKPFWWERFFSSQYLRFDKPYPGSVAFVNELFKLGADMVYLTGRDAPNMEAGTRENLARDGFPTDEKRTHLIMKAHASLCDLTHKREIVQYISGRGVLVASFENEPQNFVALAELFPEAMHIFMQTVCSDRPAQACRNVYRIRSFDKNDIPTG